MDHALEVADLTITFGAAPVIQALSFSVARGSTLAIIGPNGSGKTLLFRALIGAVRHGGTVRWAAGTRIGYVPQKLDVQRDLPVTGKDLLVAKAAVARSSDVETDRALELVDLPAATARRPIGTLSGGQFQRLLLAAALIGRPSVLLFDEPTAGIDEPGQEQLYEMIHRVQRAHALTLLLISHELSVVYRHATNVLCLSRGRRCFGPPTEVLTPAAIQECYGAPLRYHRHD
ncbi:metal ABC transporter ATP-binding protein [Anaeromyxobacter sp. PSR-1]|uniref:metal ABC transporter ATP-binding protein n=1 Tax=Anaeromyxobacter sp. PSR-1 TaxID=1300915 RepID=UPI0005DCB7F7|nr:metal ABC transporter ATP-binding protein [Anaeromyxobacter sp. PSR-1]GAO01261.1 putative metal transport system ATP-binding protein [Anaeromyxobacter sp. PSR-1]